MAIKARFKNAISRGTGDTQQILKQHPHVDFSKEIIYAATHNLAYDQQSEGPRAEYICEIIALAAQKTAITEFILTTLLHQKDDDYGLGQMCEIARLWAMGGNTHARDVLYKRYEMSMKPGYTYCGGESIIALDGMTGLLRVTDLRGRQLSNNTADWEDGWMLQIFQEDNPDINVHGLLADAAKVNSNIAAYLLAVEDNRRLREGSDPRQSLNYTLLKSGIESGTIRYIPRNIGKLLSEDDVKSFANAFLAEKRVKKLAVYLRLFTRIKFPYPYGPILDLAKNQCAKNETMLSLAIDALSFFKSPELRIFALEGIARHRYPEIFLPLLSRNYRKGDHKLLADIIAAAKSAHRIDQIAHDCINIYTANKTPECRLPIGLIYEKLNCGLCRKNLVVILIGNDALSPKIALELPYDCNMETRQLIAH